MKVIAKKDDLLVRYWIPNGDLLETGYMVYPDGLDALAPDILKPMYVLTGEGTVRKVTADGDGFRIDRSDAIPMLGSSIMDATEKNVYQGDIVSSTGASGLVQVCFLKGTFALLLEQSGRPLYFPLMNIAGEPPITVVGNIYESPELPVLFGTGWHRV